MERCIALHVIVPWGRGWHVQRREAMAQMESKPSTCNEESWSGARREWQNPEQFARNVRNAWPSYKTGGPCILDLSHENAAEFGQGGMVAVATDLKIASLPADLVSAVVSVVEELGIYDAVDTRRELINYKKVMHHVVLRITASERELRQLAALLYCQQDTVEEQTMYRELAQLLQHCRGCQQACLDVRSLTRAICCLPRCRLMQPPDAWQPFARALGQVVRALSRKETVIPFAAEHDTSQDSGILPMSISSKLVKLLQERLATWPSHIVEYVDLSLIARGVDKAFRIREELTKFGHALAGARSQIAQLLDVARELKAESGHQEMSLAAVDACRRSTFLEGLDSIAADAALRVKDMLAGRRAFIAGDGRVSTLPRDWTAVPTALRCFEDAKHRFTPSAQRVLERVGWPPLEGSINCDVIGDSACSHCKVKFRPLWVHRGSCFACAGQRRSNNQCPYRDCSRHVFCCHSSRCMGCEDWSCHQCRLLRLDGEGVAALVDTSQPATLFFDFCQTLATTKKGQAPVPGVHSLQPELAEVARRHSNVHVVTRNRYVDEICSFLSEYGLGHVVVHSVKREGRSKAECIGEILAGQLRALVADNDATSGPALFVDDDVAEHAKVDLCSLDLDRVLFQHTTL